MWTLRTVRGGEKMVSVSDSSFATKAEMMNEVGRFATTYKRRVGQIFIVHVAR